MTQGQTEDRLTDQDEGRKDLHSDLVMHQPQLLMIYTQTQAALPLGLGSLGSLGLGLREG